MTSFVSLLFPALTLSRLRNRNNSGARVETQLRLPRGLNEIAYATLRAERALIRAGLNLPLGGSLLAIARKSAGDERQVAATMSPPSP